MTLLIRADSICVLTLTSDRSGVPGSTAERVCLAGDSAGGNLCITVSMRAISNGITVPHGIMAAYPATLLTTDASPSRLLTLIDPLLPLGVLAKCLNAYAGMYTSGRPADGIASIYCRSHTPSWWLLAFISQNYSLRLSLPGADSQTMQPAVGSGTLSSLGRDTAVLLGDLTQGATNWIQSFLDPKRNTGVPHSPSHRKRSTNTHKAFSHSSPSTCGGHMEYPEGFEPLRSDCLAYVQPTTSPIIRNPFVSPLLAPNNLLRGLPPVHIVVRRTGPYVTASTQLDVSFSYLSPDSFVSSQASALDALLDDSVMFAKKLRDMGQPVSLTVVEDLPHGFLSLSQLSKETDVAAEICLDRMRSIFEQANPKRSA